MGPNQANSVCGYPVTRLPICIINDQIIKDFMSPIIGAICMRKAGTRLQHTKTALFQWQSGPPWHLLYDVLIKSCDLSTICQVPSPLIETILNRFFAILLKGIYNDTFRLASDFKQYSNPTPPWQTHYLPHNYEKVAQVPAYLKWKVGTVYRWRQWNKK